MAERLPFDLRGIDSDNDLAFIDQHLLRYCQQRKSGFTRSRPYRKNDRAYIEQRNCGPAACRVWPLRQRRGFGLPAGTFLRLWVNFFRPVVRLQEKEEPTGLYRSW